MPRPTEVRPSRATLALAALALLPFLNAIPGGFVYDDAFVIRDNPLVMGPHASAAALVHYVHQPGALYRPLTMLTYRANAALCPSPQAFHAVNVALHALVTLLAFGALRRVTGSVSLAFPAAALFAVHPIHTDAVTNIVGRAELLAAAFVLAAIRLAATAASRRAPAIPQATAALAVFLGCLCKESAFAGFALAPAAFLWLRRNAGGRAGAASAAVPYVLGALAFLGLRLAIFGTLRLPYRPTWVDNPLAHLLPRERMATALVIVWQYVATLMAPLHLSADYSFNQVPPVVEATDPRLWGAAAVLAGVGFVCVAAWRWTPWPALGALFFCVTLGLTSNVPFPIGTIKAERLLYLPSLGFCLAVAAAIEAGARSGRAWRAASHAVLCLLVLGYAARTWLRNPVWRTERTLWERTVHTAPFSAKAHFNLGAILEREGEPRRALAEYRRALNIFPYHGSAAAGIARIHLEAGRVAGALSWLERALDLDPDDAEVHYNHGLFWYRRGRLDAAEAAYRQAIERDPRHAWAHLGLAVTLLAQGRLWLASLEADRAEELGPPADQEFAKLLWEVRTALRGKGLRETATRATRWR